MKIKMIHMKEYKRFYDLTIDLGESPKRIVALVGPNGCGKSSVFDAMLFSVRNYVGQVGSAGNIKDYHYHSLEQNPNYSPNNIELVFDQGNIREVFDSLRNKGKERCLFSFRSSFRYNNNLNIKQTRSMTDIENNNYGASTASDLDQRIEEDYRRLLAKFNRYRDENDLRPSEALRDILTELNDAIGACIDLEITSIGDIDSDRGTLFFKKRDSDIEFNYNVLSAGEKEVIDLLLDLYLRKDAYTESIYIIDEPELHLNTSIQRSLLIEINKIIPENCQIWIATHSIGFLRAMQEELKDESQIIEFDSDNKWASEQYTLRPVSVSRSKWQDLFSTALDDLAKLISPKILIYCEGKDRPEKDGEEKGIDAKVYNRIFSVEFPDVLFISSGGNTELDERSEIATAIFSKVFPDLEIWVLKDRDITSGKSQDEKDRKLYLENNPESYRVLKRFELENYLYDKEVLKKYCKKNNLQFDETNYDREIQDIVNENVKDKTGKIKNFCSIKTSIHADNFKINLAECIDKSMNVYNELKDVIFKRK